jgi:hypothetical protein
MLTREALEAAIPLATVLDDHNVFLAPVENTPLAALVNATRSDVLSNVVRTDGARMQLDLENILYMANCKDSVTGLCDHDVEMDRWVEIAAKAVQGHMQFARSTVAAAVGDLAEKTCNTLQALTPSSLLGMEVKVYAFPEPLQSGQLESSVVRFAAELADEPRLGMRMPMLGYAELLDLASSGSGSFDKDVQTWLAAKGETFLTSLWEEVFTQKQAALNSAAKSFFTFTEDRECGVDNALAIFLLSRRLVEAPIEGVEMPLQQFENLAADFRNQAASRLQRAFAEMDTIVKTSTLVRSATDRVTVVNDKVYRAWIEAGGDNEVLFGNMLQSPVVVTVDNINARAAEFKSSWLRHAALTATVENNRRFSRTKEILEKTFVGQLNEIGAEDETVRANLDLTLSRFRDELASAKESDLEDLYGLCLRLVCRSRFPHTNAEEILSGIERIKRENPKIEVREAAAVAVIEYVAKWVSSQFAITRR